MLITNATLLKSLLDKMAEIDRGTEYLNIGGLSIKLLTKGLLCHSLCKTVIFMHILGFYKIYFFKWIKSQDVHTFFPKKT